MSGSAEFVIALKDQMSGPLASVKSALSSLTGALKGGGGDLKNLQDQVGGAGKAAQGSAGEVSQFGGAVEALGGPIGIAITVITAIVAALGVATLAMASFALQVTGARNALLAQLGAATGSAAAAREVAAAIDDIAAKTPVARDTLEQMGRALAVAGLKGGELKGALESLAVVAGTAGTDAAGKLQALIEKASAAGSFQLTTKSLLGTGLSEGDVIGALAAKLHKSIPDIKAALKAGKVSVADGVDAINAAVRQRFGDANAAQMLNFDVQITKLKENLAKLFEGVDTKPFLSALHDLLSIFDSSTESGKAMKAVITTVFSGLFAVAGAVLPYVKALLLGMWAAGLSFYNALKPLGRALASAFGDGKTSATGLEAAMLAGKVVMWTLIGVLASLAAVMLVVAVLSAIIFLPFLVGAALVGVAIYAVVWAVGAVVDLFEALPGYASAAWDAVVAAVMSAVDSIESTASSIWQSIVGPIQDAISWLSSIDLGSIGSDMMSGLVSGILGGVSGVVASVLSLGAQAIATLRSVLHIASPSKVFATLGDFTAQGFAQGIDSGQKHVDASVSSMVSTPQTASAKSAGKGGGATANIVINVAAGTPADQVSALRDAVVDALRQLGIGLGEVI